MANYNLQVGKFVPVSSKSNNPVHNSSNKYTFIPANTNSVVNNGSSDSTDVSVDVSPILSSARSIVELNNKSYANAANNANVISQNSSAQQYKYNSDEAEKSRKWQEMMSNTAHQREVADLIKAGLNPVLSASLGGASTPSGATASGSSFTGQKAEVDTQYLGLLISLYENIMTNNTNKDIARINAETALQTAKINSFSGSPFNRFVNAFIGNSAERNGFNALGKTVLDEFDSWASFVHSNALKRKNKK